MFQELFSYSPEDISQFVWFETSLLGFPEPLHSEIRFPPHYVSIVPVLVDQMVGERPSFPHHLMIRVRTDGGGERENIHVGDKMRIRI